MHDHNTTNQFKTKPMKPIFPQLETSRMMATLRIAFTIILALWAFRSCYAQTFTITPSPTLKVNAPGGWSGSSVTYNPSDRSFSAKDGLYIPDAYNVVGGFYVEMNVKTDSSTVAGCFLTKPGTGAWGMNTGKIKVDYLWNGSIDQVNGMRTLPKNEWVTIGFGYDTLGRSVASINGIVDINRETVVSGSPQQTTDKWNFLKGMPGRCRWIKVWCNSKPPTLPAGFDCHVRLNPDTAYISLNRIDRSYIGKALTIIQESPNGSQSTLSITTLSQRLLKFYLDPEKYQNGSWTFIVSAGSIQHRLTRYKAATKPTLPKSFVSGVYAVNSTDLRRVRDLGANAAYYDFPVLNWDRNYKAIGYYLDSCQKLGLQSVVRMGYQASKGNLEFVSDLSKSNIAWYAVDEGAGLFGGLERNYWTCKATNPTVPVIVNLNQFSRINEASQYSDILMCNIYSSGRVVYDITSQSVKLRPTWVTIPQYANIQYSRDQMLNLTAQAVVAGASGVWFFEWDHRTKSNLSDWYTPNSAEKVENLRACLKWLKDMPLDWSLIPTVNPNIAACRKGGRSIYVNLTDKVQMEGDVQFGSLEVREF